MIVADHGEAQRLIEFIDAAPSPYHAVAEVSSRLQTQGFMLLDEADAWPTESGRYLVVRGGSLIAWDNKRDSHPLSGFRIIGAHTDSPNLRVKPRPDTGGSGYRQLGVEVYGGALLNSWLDRDLGVSGRVSVREGDRPSTQLFRVDRPLLRIPQLAIHLDRSVNEQGVKLNPQQHLMPLWSIGPPDEGEFRRFLAKELGLTEDAVLSWDAMLHDLAGGAVLGLDDEFVSAPRIDNLASCHAATRALIDQIDIDDWAGEAPGIPVVCLFDHEEIGSQSTSGADGTFLVTVLERIADAAELDRSGFHRAMAASMCLSADGAHATHPNYPERHDPAHPILLNGGPVLKANASVRYATDAETAARFELACDAADVPLQRFVSRSDMPCGSTIGPVTAARLGVPTVDVGIPQLSMHSARELCGTRDPAWFVDALWSFLTST
jgi:aspartyl aminopeptidase